MRRLLHGLAVDVGDQPAARQPADLGAGEVRAGVDGEDAGRRLRLFDGYFPDAGVRVRRTHERGIRLVRQRDVVGVLPGAGQEAVVLLARDARADQRGVHIFPPIARAPAMMLLTMLW